jgi:hypothetical protein
MLPYQQVDLSTWEYTEPRRNPKNGLNVFLHTSQKRNPMIQLDRCRVPFGVQDGMEESSRKNLELAVGNPDFLSFAQGLDAQNIKWTADNSLAVFKKEMNVSTVEALYRTLLSPQKNGFEPLLRLKINASGKSPTQVMVVLQEATATQPLKYRAGTLDDVMPHCQVLPIVEVVGLWFIAKGFGMTLVATDLLVFPAPKVGGWHFHGISAVQCEDENASQLQLPEAEGTVVNAPTIISMTGASRGEDDVDMSAHGTE